MNRVTELINGEYDIKEEFRKLYVIFGDADEWCALALGIAERLGRFEEAEAQGLIVRYPCHKGDIVYVLQDDNNYENFEAGIVADIITHNGKTIISIALNEGTKQYRICDFGKKVFADKEEMEKVKNKLTEACLN